MLAAEKTMVDKQPSDQEMVFKSVPFVDYPVDLFFGVVAIAVKLACNVGQHRNFCAVWGGDRFYPPFVIEERGDAV